MSENAGGTLVQYQTDKEQVNKWIDLDIFLILNSVEIMRTSI